MTALELVFQNSALETLLKKLKLDSFADPLARANAELAKTGLRLEVEQVMLVIKPVSDETPRKESRQTRCDIVCQGPPPFGDGHCHVVCK